MTRLLSCIIILTIFSQFNCQDVESTNKLIDIIHSIQKFFVFLCTRCEEIVLNIDNVIENQTLKKDASKLCAVAFGQVDIVNKICQSLVEDVLGEVFNQLKKFEPDRIICAHLHLCDACNIPTAQPITSFSTPSSMKPFVLIRNDSQVDFGKLLINVAKLHQIAFYLASNSTTFHGI